MMHGWEHGLSARVPAKAYGQGVLMRRQCSPPRACAKPHAAATPLSPLRAHHAHQHLPNASTTTSPCSHPCLHVHSKGTPSHIPARSPRTPPHAPLPPPPAHPCAPTPLAHAKPHPMLCAIHVLPTAYQKCCIKPWTIKISSNPIPVKSECSFSMLVLL